MDSLRARVYLWVPVVFACLLLFPGRTNAQVTGVLDEIVAVVGDQIILRSDVDLIVSGFAAQRGIPPTNELWNDALNSLIDQKVMAVHAGRDTTIIITDQQVDQALEMRVNQLTSQMGGQAQLEEVYGKSVVQIKEDLRGDFRNQMLAEQFQQRRVRNIKITPSEVQRWFDQFPTDSLPSLPETVRIAHIVRYPKVTDAARGEAQDILSTIRDSIVTSGGSFEQLAQAFSDDPGSAANGGHDTGRKLTDLVPEFAAMAARIPIGEISQIFETQFGLHILRVNQRTGDVIDYNHILIRFDESKSDPAPAIDYLKIVADSMKTYKMPFELMARRHSEEQASAARGGRVVDPRSEQRDLPLQALGPTWQVTINRLDEGEMSEPTEVALLDGRRAYHVLLLQRRTPAHRVNIQTDYDRIEQIALQEKQQTELRRWMDMLRQDVYIDIRGRSESLSQN